MLFRNPRRTTLDRHSIFILLEPQIARKIQDQALTNPLPPPLRLLHHLLQPKRRLPQHRRLQLPIPITPRYQL